MESDKLYVEHILEAIMKIERYVAGFDFQKFDKNELVQDGVVRELEIVGEAAKHLSGQFKTSRASVPWADISNMRNKLIHEYFGVDTETVWKTINEDLPKLKDTLKK